MLTIMLPRIRDAITLPYQCLPIYAIGADYCTFQLGYNIWRIERHFIYHKKTT